jgi:hypothetical protein
VASLTSSTPLPLSKLSSSRSNCSTRCSSSSVALVVGANSTTHRAPSTSTCCSTTNAKSTARNCSLPHPRMHLRAFVIAPLLEIAPLCRIPGRGSAAAWLPAVSQQRIEKLGE